MLVARRRLLRLGLAGIDTLTLAAALPAKAAVLVQSHVAVGADSKHIAPFMRVTSDSSTSVNVGGQVLSYFFYEQSLPITFGTLVVLVVGFGAWLGR